MAASSGVSATEPIVPTCKVPHRLATNSPLRSNTAAPQQDGHGKTTKDEKVPIGQSYDKKPRCCRKYPPTVPALAPALQIGQEKEGNPLVADQIQMTQSVGKMIGTKGISYSPRPRPLDGRSPKKEPV